MRTIPGFENFRVTKDLKILNVKTGNILSGSINGAGYRFYHLSDGENGDSNVGEHRLIALAYHGLPLNEKFVVKHKDGNKLNNEPENLEWCSQQENCIHAGEAGLSGKALSVQVRNIRTKEVLSFRTMIECAEYLGISKDAVSYRCKFGQFKIFPGALQFRSPSSKEDWMDMEDIDMLLLDKSIVVRNLLTKEEIAFEKLQDCAKFLGITPGGLTSYFKRNTQPVVKEIYQLKKTSDKTIWLEPKILKVTQKVKVVNTLTGEEIIYNTARKAAFENGLTPTSLDYRLSLEGNKVFSDNKTYTRV